MCAAGGKLRLDENSCPVTCQGRVLELYPQGCIGSFAVIWIVTYFPWLKYAKRKGRDSGHEIWASSGLLVWFG